MYVIVTNHVNWHRENVRSDRENTGNLKTLFEWVPRTYKYDYAPPAADGLTGLSRAGDNTL